MGVADGMIALAVFSLRLAVGMLACLLLLHPDTGTDTASPRNQRVGFRYYRTHFLTALGLAGLALVCLWDSAPGGLLILLGGGMALAVAGSAVWALHGAPFGRMLVLLTPSVLFSALAWLEWPADTPLGPRLLGDATSAAVLGTAMSAMLLGHFHLISPALSARPLMRLLGAVAVALTARAVADGWALARWTSEHSLANLNGEVALWLPVRWLIGFIAPLILDAMAAGAARIRSTQSATGILYVVVICCFLGELTALLLQASGTTL
jgi:hypothetical protein